MKVLLYDIITRAYEQGEVLAWVPLAGYSNDYDGTVKPAVMAVVRVGGDKPHIVTTEANGLEVIPGRVGL